MGLLPEKMRQHCVGLGGPIDEALEPLEPFISALMTSYLGEERPFEGTGLLSAGRGDVGEGKERLAFFGGFGSANDRRKYFTA